MYVPQQFDETRQSELHRLIAAHPLGTLITHGADGLDANHLPFEFDPADGLYGTLRAHVARANPIWQQVQSGAQVLVVFHGEQGYISPNWYPSKHVAHEQVPTWNYQVVHAHGRITVRDDERYVRGLVARLARTYEASQPLPWKMSAAPKEYLDAMLAAIVGIDIEVTRLVGKFKLSQNKDLRDRQTAIDILQQQGHTGLAQAMCDTISPE